MGAFDIYMKDNHAANYSRGGYGFADHVLEKNKDKIQEAWEKFGGKGKQPYARDTFHNFGEQDDVLRVQTKEEHKRLANFLLNRARKGEKFLREETEVLDIREWEECTTAEFAEEEYTGPYYIVVVDYHH